MCGPSQKDIREIQQDGALVGREDNIYQLRWFLNQMLKPHGLQLSVRQETRMGHTATRVTLGKLKSRKTRRTIA